MQNRIALLQIEEERASKKMAEANRRTRDVLKIKKKKEEFILDKMSREDVVKHEI